MFAFCRAVRLLGGLKAFIFGRYIIFVPSVFVLCLDCLHRPNESIANQYCGFLKKYSHLPKMYVNLDPDLDDLHGGMGLLDNISHAFPLLALIGTPIPSSK